MSHYGETMTLTMDKVTIDNELIQDRVSFKVAFTSVQLRPSLEQNGREKFGRNNKIVQ